MKLLLTVLVTTCVACVGSVKSPWVDSVGSYSGFLSRAQESVTIEAKAAEDGAKLQVELDSQSQAPAMKSFTLEWVTAEQLRLTVPGLVEPAANLKKSSSQCFLSEEGASPRAELCVEAREVWMALHWIAGERMTLTLSKSVPGAEDETWEKPQPYTLEELRERAKKRSFTNRVEFERLVQGRLQAEAAHASLLPRFSPTDLLGVASLNWNFLIRSAGNLTPFIFRNRWIRVDAADAAYRGQRIAFRIMNANAASMAEGLALSVMRDEEAYRQIALIQEPLTQLKERVLTRERLGLARAGDSDGLIAVLQNVEKTLLGLKQAIQVQKRALAQAAGFRNPNAITVVADGAIVKAGWGTWTVPSMNEALELAWTRSLELRQVDSMIDEAKFEKEARGWDWIDPAGGVPIGFQLPAYFESAESAIRLLGEQRRLVQAAVTQRLSEAYQDFGLAQENMELARRSRELSAKRIKRYQDQIKLGMQIPIPELQLAVQDQMRAELDHLQAQYAAVGSVARIHRLLLSGSYEDLEWVQP